MPGTSRTTSTDLSYTQDYNYDLAWVTTSRHRRLTGMSNDFSFNKVGGAFSQEFGEKLVRNNIVDMFLTKVGERVMMPTFGSNLHRLVFEMLDAGTAKEARIHIIELIRRYEPRVVVKDVHVNAEEGSGMPLNRLEHDIKSPFALVPGTFGGGSNLELDKSMLKISLTLALKDDYLNDFVIDLEL